VYKLGDEAAASEMMRLREQSSKNEAKAKRTDAPVQQEMT